MYECEEYNQIIQDLTLQVQQKVSAMESVAATILKYAAQLRTIIPIIKSLHSDKGAVASPSVPLEVYGFADGQELFEDDLRKLDHNYFDIVFNLPHNSLKARIIPQEKKSAKDCDITGLGRRRMRLLLYMLQHPKAIICPETVAPIYEDTEEISSNALAKSIRALRYLLHQASPFGPYILTDKDSAQAYSRTGHIYRMNEEWHYLLIMRNFKKSSQFPQQHTQKLPSDEF